MSVGAKALQKIVDVKRTGVREVRIETLIHLPGRDLEEHPEITNCEERLRKEGMKISFAIVVKESSHKSPSGVDRTSDWPSVDGEQEAGAKKGIGQVSEHNVIGRVRGLVWLVVRGIDVERF